MSLDNNLNLSFSEKELESMRFKTKIREDGFYDVSMGTQIYVCEKDGTNYLVREARNSRKDWYENTNIKLRRERDEGN